MKKTLFFIMGIAMSITNIKAQKASAIRPLKIGDTVPDIAFNNIINYKKTSAKLSNFKGKLIILDFWSRNCSACIAGFPKMQALQNKFKDQIQIILITADKAADTDAFWNSSRGKKFTENITLPVVAADTMAQRLFQHRIIPHMVWINDNHTAAITDGQYATAENISYILNNQSNDWPIKEELLGFDHKLPLNQIPRYHSAIYPYLPGAPATNGIINDSITGTSRIYKLNASILDLYAYAYGPLEIFADPMHRIQFHVKDIGRYIYTKEQGYRAVWKLQHLYCYEAIAPLSATEAELKQKLKSDLDYFFRLQTYINPGDPDLFVITELL